MPVRARTLYVGEGHPGGRLPPTATENRMTSRLSFEDRRYLADLLEWDERRRPTELLLGRIALATGGGLIVAGAVLTLRDLRDATVLAVLLPLTLAGLFLVLVSRVGRAWVCDRHRLAGIARHLGLDT
jgi:hypothetical protein